MIICPECGRVMIYREGENNNRHYEFYGCSGYPYECTNTVSVNEAYRYDDGKKYESSERSIEEEAEGWRDALLKDGWSWEDAEYARNRWENEK